MNNKAIQIRVNSDAPVVSVNEIVCLLNGFRKQVVSSFRNFLEKENDRKCQS